MPLVAVPTGIMYVSNFLAEKIPGMQKVDDVLENICEKFVGVARVVSAPLAGIIYGGSRIGRQPTKSQKEYSKLEACEMMIHEKLTPAYMALVHGNEEVEIGAERYD